MSVTLNVSALKTRESTSDPWQGAVVKSDAILDAGTITYDGTETYTAGTVGQELSSQSNTINQLETETETIENGMAIIVDGDTCSTAVPVGSYAYIKNNAHGLADGLYTNTSSSAFPVSGGTADSTVFTAVPAGGFNLFNGNLTNLKDISFLSQGNTILDLNTVKTQGAMFMFRSASTLNGPSDYSDSFFILTFAPTSNQILQMLFPWSSTYQHFFYSRTYVNGEWGSWSKFLST